jgi:uncharacterized protein (TIGR03067 family)
MLEGDWHIQSVDYGGEALPERHGQLQILAGRFSLQISGTPRQVGAVELDPAAHPAPALDLIWHEAGTETRRLRAIVRVRGELMQFCYYPDAALPRPAAFASTGTPPAILVRCRRVEPAG